MQEGIYFGLSAEQYHAAPGLSHSGCQDLAVSPLNYWHKRVDPDRKPEGPTKAMRLGTAIHCRLLEPEAFGRHYARGLAKADHPDALETVGDLKFWLSVRGLPTAHKRKQDLTDRVEAYCLQLGEEAAPVIWDKLAERHACENAGKEILPPADYERVSSAAAAALAEPAARRLLAGGYPEVSIFLRDPESNLLQKCRIDYLAPRHTLDLKTFTNPGKLPLKKAVNREIERRRYYEQGVWYHDLRERARRLLAQGKLRVFGEVDPNFVRAFAGGDDHRFVFLFVESEAPHHLDLPGLIPAVEGGPTPEKYWLAARQRQRDAVTLAAHCEREYGPEPWRAPLEPRELSEFDLPFLAYEVDDDAAEDYLACAPAGMQEMGANEL